MNRTDAIKYLVEKYDEWPSTLPLREPDHVTWGWLRVDGEIKFFNKSEPLELNICEHDWERAKNEPARDPKFWSREKTLEAMVEHIDDWPKLATPPLCISSSPQIILRSIGWNWVYSDTLDIILRDRACQLEDIERDDWLVANDPLRDWAKPLSTPPEPVPVVMTRDEALHYLKTNIGNWPRPSDHTHAVVNGWEWSALMGKSYMVFVRSSKKSHDMPDEDVIKFSAWAEYIRPATKKPLVMGREQAIEHLRVKYDTWPTRDEVSYELVDGWSWSVFLGETTPSFIRHTAPNLLLTDNDIIHVHHWQTPAEGTVKIYSGAVGDVDRKLLAETPPKMTSTLDSPIQLAPKEPMSAESVVATPTLEDLARFASMHQPTPLVATDPIMKYFEWSHLPAKLQAVSEPLCEMAKTLDELLPEGPEKAAGMRKLLEAKDCLVRAIL